jgi:hypothetical protein
VALHPHSLASVFIYSLRGKRHLPLLLWNFPPIATFTSFPTPGCWAGASAPTFSGRLVYLQFHDGLPLAYSLELRAPHPLCYVSFFFQLLVYYSVCFFPGWESVCPGGYADLAWVCLWEYRVPLSSSGGLLLPRRLGAGIWWHESPPGFSV